MPITRKQIERLRAIGWIAEWRREDREAAREETNAMKKAKATKPKLAKPVTHEDRYQMFLEEVSAWCKTRQGRSQELAAILGVDRRKISDWFVSRRFDPPGWVVFTIPRVLIATSSPKN